jgi:hypothetical protein
MLKHYLSNPSSGCNRKLDQQRATSGAEDAFKGLCFKNGQLVVPAAACLSVWMRRCYEN